MKAYEMTFRDDFAEHKRESGRGWNCEICSNHWPCEKAKALAALVEAENERDRFREALTEIMEARFCERDSHHLGDDPPCPHHFPRKIAATAVLGSPSIQLTSWGRELVKRSQRMKEEG